MGPPVDAFDDRVGCALQFIVEPRFDQPSGDRCWRLFAVKRKAD
jgi:hypothetical protein